MGIMYKLMKHRNLAMDLNAKPTSKTKSDKCRLLTIDGHIIQTDVNNYMDEDNDDSVNAQATPTVPRQSETQQIEKRFATEHILQLCKFLAEKSKRNKNFHKKQQSPKKLTKTQKSFQFQPMDYNDNDCDIQDSCMSDNNDMSYDNVHDGTDDEVERLQQNEALPLLNNFRRKQHKHFEDSQLVAPTILSSRLSPDINALNISSSSTTSSASATLALTNQQQHLSHHLQQEHFYQQQQHNQQSQQLQQHHQHQQQGKRDILLKIRHQIFERKRLREKGYEPQAFNVAAATQVWRPW